MSALPKRPKLPPPPIGRIPTRPPVPASSLRLVQEDDPPQRPSPTTSAYSPTQTWSPTNNLPQFQQAQLGTQNRSSFIKRLVASMIDTFAMGLISNFATPLMARPFMPNQLMAQVDPQLFEAKLKLASSVAGLLSWALVGCIGAYLISTYGGMPGKLLMKMKIYDTKNPGNYPSFWQAVSRENWKILSAFFFMLGFLAALRKEKLTWHDKLSKTEVIDS